jgi:hypothetical protein
MIGHYAGVWQISGATPIVQSTDEDFKQSIDMFKLCLESSLWPTIKLVGGEFDIMVNIDMSNSTLVNLNYFDISEQHGSYYEHHNRLGGMIAPYLGDHTVYDNNANQLHGLVGEISNQVIGTTRFGNHQMQPQPSNYGYDSEY